MRTALLTAFFANFALFGASAILVGAAVPEIIREFSWSYLEIGVVLSAGSVGFFCSTFLCGLLVGHIGPQKTLVGGLVLQGVGLALIGQSPALWPNLAAIVLVGLGEGGSEVATNFCLVWLEKSGRSQLMNFIYAAFTAGAILGPLSIGLLARTRSGLADGLSGSGRALAGDGPGLRAAPLRRIARIFRATLAASRPGAFAPRSPAAAIDPDYPALRRRGNRRLELDRRILCPGTRRDSGPGRLYGIATVGGFAGR